MVKKLVYLMLLPIFVLCAYIADLLGYDIYMPMIVTGVFFTFYVITRVKKLKK